MDSVSISSISQSVNNNLVYTRPEVVYRRPNTECHYTEPCDGDSYNHNISAHKKLCKDLQYNNNNNEYLSEESEESDSETNSSPLFSSPPPLGDHSGLASGLVTSSPQEATGYPPSQATAGLGLKRSRTPDRKKTKGRLKVEMKYLEDKLKRNTTFNKRKNGMLKKAYELSTLTGTEILVVIASEAGYIHTFATKKLQPVIASQQGQEFIQDCLMNEEDPESETDLTGSDPTQNGVMSKWKASKQKSHVTGNHVTTGEAEVSGLPPLPATNGLPIITSVSSPLYGQAAKTEPLYDGVYGQMPQTAQQPYTAMYGGVMVTQDEKSNSSYSNLSPPSSTSILQGALSGTVENYGGQQYTPQVCATNTEQLVQTTAPSLQTTTQTSTGGTQSASVGYTSYSLASLPDYITPQPTSTTPQYTRVQSLATTPDGTSPQATSAQGTTQTSADYEFETDPGKTVYIKVPVKEEPGEVGCYWS